MKVKEVLESLTLCDPQAEVILVLQYHGREQRTLAGLCRRSDLALFKDDTLPGGRPNDVLFIEGDPFRPNPPNGSPPSR